MVSLTLLDIVDSQIQSHPPGTLPAFGDEPPAAPPISPDNPPWGVGLAVLVLLLSIVCLIIVPIPFILFYTMQRGVALRDLPAFATSDPGAIFVQIAAMLPYHLVMLGVAWAVVTRFGKYPFLPTLGWSWSPKFGLGASVGLTLLLLMVGLLLISLTGKQETQIDRIISSSRAAALMTAFVATFTAPLVEEIIYRGILYSALQRAIGMFWAIIIVLSVFAAIHVPQYQSNYGVISTILLLSVFLTLVRAYTGRLLPCVVMHFIFNGIQSALIVAQPYLQPYFQQNEPPPVAPVVEAVRLCVPLL